MSEQEEVEAFALADLPRELGYVEIPSISAQHQGIDETVAWLTNAFTELTADTIETWHDQGGNPVVFAEFKGKADKTVLFYNHYDVQPPEPLDEWHSEPFTPTEKDGRIYARGIQDDKGELMSRLAAVRYMKDHGGIPLNLKFFVEGEEEVGSVHVDAYVKAHAARLAADTCIWEGGGKNADGRFDITCGLKGITTFDLHVKTADKDVHSSLGGVVDNAAWRLVKALSSLRDDDNHVLVDGFYDDIQPFSAETMATVLKNPFNTAALTQDRGLKRPLITDEPQVVNATKPTMTINGIAAGYAGDGIKTIVPKEASAKVDCRLAVGQDPQVMADRVKAQLDKNGFADVKLTYLTGEPAFMSDVEDPSVQAALATADAIYGDSAVTPIGAGSGPASQFASTLNVPLIMVGVGGNGGHSPNEYIVKHDYAQGTYFMIKYLQKLAE